MTYFQFEQDFADSLRCIPMIVRLKLDTCGIKLKLPQWLQLTAADRQQLVDFPCATPDEVQHYRATLETLIQERTGSTATPLPVETAPDWLNANQIPTSVLEQARSVNAEITLSQWQFLSPIQRFALIKLSRSSHENKNFLPAMKEFGL